MSGHGTGELQNLSLFATPSREGHAEPAPKPLPPGIVRPRGLEHPPAFKGVIQAAGLGRALETEAENHEVEVGGRSCVEGSLSFLLTIPEGFRLSTPRKQMPCPASIGLGSECEIFWFGGAPGWQRAEGGKRRSCGELGPGELPLPFRFDVTCPSHGSELSGGS